MTIKIYVQTKEEAMKQYKDMTPEERQQDLAESILREIQKNNSSVDAESLKKIAEGMASVFLGK